MDHRSTCLLFAGLVAGIIAAPMLAQEITNSGNLSPAVARYVAVDASKGAVRLIHARVIDGTGAAALENQTVEITGGKISALRATLPSDVPNGKTTLDMSGRTVLPGLVGMHDHLFYVASPDLDAEHVSGIPLLLPQMTYSAPRLYLASGVTTIRTTGSLDLYRSEFEGCY